MSVPVQMPKMGNSVEECLIVEWKVAEGAAVKEGDALCSIETDKASFEVPSPAAGTVLKLFRGAGELVKVLTNIAAIGNAGEDASSLAPEGGTSAAPAAPAAPATPATPAAPVAAAPAAPAPASGDLRVSPRARHLAAHLGVDAAAVPGSGPQGRVTSRDVQAAADSGLRLTPLAREVAGATGKIAGAGAGVGGRVRASDLVAPGARREKSAPAEEKPPVEIPYKGIRKLIGDRMLQSLQRHAQLTLNASADATALLAHRKTLKDLGPHLGLPNITLNDLVCYVVAQTLPKFPALNAWFDGQKVTQFTQAHLALAVDTERGLMVPVVRDAHRLDLAGLAGALADLAKQCKAGSINPDLLQGGTFTITNLGALGIESFTPVLNTPQVAILGICSIADRAVADGQGGLRLQPTLGLSLTIDHQVVDGAPAAKFLKAVAEGVASFQLA